MKDYSVSRFEVGRDWIQKSHSKNIPWDNITYGGRDDEEGLVQFLNEQSQNNYWEISKEEWIELVKLEREEVEKRINEVATRRRSIVTSELERIPVTLPTNKRSSWIMYKNRLLNVSKFSKESVDEIEKATIDIFSSLTTDTRLRGPVKGLVVGNVQSGKTANMAALMALGADYGFNMFIVLGGVIDSLRMQTQERLLDDLGVGGNIHWNGLQHLRANGPEIDKAHRKNFKEAGNSAYFTVVLKNSKRLADLIDWLHEDLNTTRNMKIMVIDDESDQASVNTGKIDEPERKRINQLITSLVHGKDKNGHLKEKDLYRAMNYIGYTATPYANVLNEVGDDTLFPKDFIISLAQSAEYFGPQQIFGIEGRQDGLDIVRVISKNEIDEIKKIHNKKSNTMPQCLEDSLLWFLCAGAALRVRGFKKPLSFLVHTSVRISHHETIYHIIKDFFSDKITANVKKAEELWNVEKERFNKINFESTFKNYANGNAKILDLPSFDDFREELIEILEEKAQKININEEGTLTYGEGVHICVDNGSASNLADENEYVRLSYPTTNELKSLSKAPLFIVIGGATLSRGLTIEGLVSTYFVRTSGMADTLMQMGRWFGYRKNYELYPRIWMPSKTISKFEFLSSLDDDLRESIELMAMKRQRPDEVGLKINNTPALSFLRITSANKMQSAVEGNFDYTGMSSQIVVFDKDEELKRHNIALTERFINSLGVPDINEVNDKNKANLIYRNVSYDYIYNKFLKEYHISANSRALSDMENLSSWIMEITKEGLLDNWNVIVAGKGQSSKDNSILDGNRWYFNNASIEIVNRSLRKSEYNNDRQVFGVISGPGDMISDIDISKFDEKRAIKDLRTKEAIFNSPKFSDRTYFQLDKTPQLIIYRVNTINGEEESVTDPVSIMINIPGGDRRSASKSYAKKLNIDLSKIKRMDTFEEDENNED